MQVHGVLVPGTDPQAGGVVPLAFKARLCMAHGNSHKLDKFFLCCQRRHSKEGHDRQSKHQAIWSQWYLGVIGDLPS